jgi:preprotein translocase subunit SecY
VLATWLLKHAARGNDALVGDLFEEHRRRCSNVWYWRQVLTAVVVNLSSGALLVLGIVALVLIGSRFSVPGAHADALTLQARRAVGTPFGPLSILTGGQPLGVTIFALGLVALFLERSSAIIENEGLRIVANPGGMFRVTTLLTLTAGTTSLMLISDQISKRQIGNGMFLVCVAGIVAGLSRTLGLVDPSAVLTYAALHVAVVGVVSHGYRPAIAPPLHPDRPMELSSNGDYRRDVL